MFVCGLSVGGSNSLAIKVSDLNSASIKKVIAEYLGQRLGMSPVDIQSVENNYRALYREDYKLVKMVSIFSSLAIFLTCVGIFGLAAFSAQRRKREVAIRKVIGASRFNLIGLLSKESILLVSLGALIAFPIAYNFVEIWLNNFNYRISQSILPYVMSGLLVTMITQLTISIIAFRAANSSPSSILRTQ